MTNYIMTILSIGICAFILESVLSSFYSYKNISTAVKLVYSLCIFCSIVFPVFSIKLDFSKIQNKTAAIIQNGTAQDIPSLDLLLKKELEEKTNSEIFNQSGILCDSISIDLNINNTDGQKNICVTNVRITLSQTNSDKITQIQDCLKTIPELNEAKTTFIFSGKDSYEQETAKHNT